MVHSVERPIAEKNRIEIEAKLNSMGDFVKMSYLQRALKSNLDFDTRKFCLIRLGGIYEGRKMYLEAARLFKSAAEINTTYKDKIRDYMKAIELFVRGGDYAESDRLFGQALALGNSREKDDIRSNYKNFVISQARGYVNADRRSNAAVAYEKALQLELDMGERMQVQKELLALYDKLGKVKEYYSLKKRMEQ